MTTRTNFGMLLLAIVIVALFAQQALALMWGDVGNAPVVDPGWPAGVEPIFNTPSRIAWWTGDGRPMSAECRGDAKALSAVLADFAKLEVKVKQVVLRDGIGRSYWLNNREPEKADAAKMDWVFTIWDPAERKRQGQRLGGLNRAEAKDAGPPPQIEVYTGGNVRWPDVIVPDGLKIVDMRLEAHGFTVADGIVLEGKVTSMATGKPVEAVMRLERVELQAKGGNKYPLIAAVAADAQGRWVLKKAPAGWHRVVVEAEGFVPRVAGYVQSDGQPCWQAFECGLLAAAPVAGRVFDEDGKPLADVNVRFDVVTTEAGHYESPFEHTYKTGDDGTFRAANFPVGKTTIWVNKAGYCRPGLGLAITLPQDGVELRMIKAAKAVVTVDFTGKERPEGYMVHFEPEGGSKIGSYGGSGNISDKNQIIYDNVPPGRYVFHGRPNPGSDNQQTESITVDLKGGQTTDVKLSAK